MFKSPIAAALVIGGLLVTTACASSTASPSAASSPGSGSPSSPATTSSSASSSPTAGSTAPAASACAGATPVAGPVVRLTNSDNGKQLCVGLGTTFEVRLHGTVAEKWVSIHSSSPLILAAKPDPGLMLLAGWTGAAFEAIRPGTAYLSASRYPCGSSSPSMHKIQCGVIIGYRVNVVVAS